MICQTVRKGNECFLMKSSGCSYMGGSCKSVIDKCEGCAKIISYNEQNYCSCFPDPDTRWQNGTCTMATHIKRDVEQIKKKINPLKASKKGIRS
ncbi:MAG: PxxKW family cysteine-rich protein [Deltaproteobacteria bacterium]|nr:PxxKW family cysteine-rich protein [Deltaproteobacteria bacterium]